jgi:hypothetical protein
VGSLVPDLLQLPLMSKVVLPCILAFLACCRFLPQHHVIDTFVVDSRLAQQQQLEQQPAAAADAAGSSSSSSSNGASSSSSSVVSVVSFYTLPSSVLGHDEHKELRAAYMFYSGEATRMKLQSCADASLLHSPASSVHVLLW